MRLPGQPQLCEGVSAAVGDDAGGVSEKADKILKKDKKVPKLRQVFGRTAFLPIL